MIPTDWLTHRARSRAEIPALRDEEGRELTYAALGERAAAVAGRLPRSGDACVIELEPGIEHAIAVHAAILAGIPLQTLRPGLVAGERAAALAGLREPVEFDPAWLDARAGAPSAPRPPRAGEDDVLCRMLTSGTSGSRRPVSLTYGNHLWSATASAFNLGLRADDAWLCCMPVDHIGGLSILIRSLIYGTTAVIHRGFELERVRAELERGVSIVSLVPTQLQRLLDADAPLERPRLLLIGGGPLPAETLDQALERGATVVQTYGLTEACSQVSTLAPADARSGRGSVGRPLLGIEITIEQDEILVSGPTVAPGSVGDDGRLHTGDRGRIDEQGYLWVEGRLDDLIVSGGENIAPDEVEVALASHPDVADVAVFGRPDPEWGHAVVACVVRAEGASPSPAELIEHARGRLAPYRVPKAIEFVDGLPRTASGKLLRRELR